MYEPYIFALANYLNQTLPPWIPQKKGKTIGKPQLGRTPRGSPAKKGYGRCRRPFLV